MFSRYPASAMCHSRGGRLPPKLTLSAWLCHRTCRRSSPWPDTVSGGGPSRVRSSQGRAAATLDDILVLLVPICCIVRGGAAPVTWEQRRPSSLDRSPAGARPLSVGDRQVAVRHLLACLLVCRGRRVVYRQASVLENRREITERGGWTEAGVAGSPLLHLRAVDRFGGGSLAWPAWWPASSMTRRSI